MEKLNKSEVVESIQEKTGLNKKTSGKALDAVVSTVRDALAAGKGVRLIGFGSFIVRNRKARRGRNPQTGKPMEIAARKSPVFKAGRSLKEAVNK